MAQKSRPPSEDQVIPTHDKVCLGLLPSGPDPIHTLTIVGPGLHLAAGTTSVYLYARRSRDSCQLPSSLAGGPAGTPAGSR